MHGDSYSADMYLRQQVESRLSVFNQNRKADKGRYCIVLPTSNTLYYTFWFHDPNSHYHPYAFLNTLELNLSGSVDMAVQKLANSFKPLQLVDQINAYISDGDDIFTFGKYRGSHLYDVYTIDPKYVTWIADKFEARVKSEIRFKELAQMYANVYLDLQVGKRYKAESNSFVGTVGEKLTDFSLIITKVRLEDDPFKTNIIQGIPSFYVDQLITAVDEQGNYYHLIVKASDRSLETEKLPAGTHAYQPNEELHIASAKVLKHYMSHNYKFTKIGYIRFTKQK